MTIRHLAVTGALILLLAACGDDSGNGNQNNNNGCPQGYRPAGPDCVPIFDDCAGPAEIPVLGGGCRAVGVTQCATGFVSDSEGGCDPVLPADPCPPGTMEVLGETQCRPVGVTQCANGFVSDGQGGCDPVLPSAPCPSSTMEILGHTDCQQISDCGNGIWGNIVTDATTIFVDAAYSGGNSDGSDASPFTTVADALAVVQPSGQIAVAAGDYQEQLIIDTPVHLAGRCADRVTLRGIHSGGQDHPPVTINGGGSGTRITGVTLTGDGQGLTVVAAQAVQVEQVQVVQTGEYGVSLANGAQAELRHVVVADCTAIGIRSEGSALSVTQSVVRDTRADGTGSYGRGIHAFCISAGACGTLDVTESLISGNRDTGLFVYAVDTTVASSVVRDTRTDTDGYYGRGIESSCYVDVGVCPTLSVTDRVIAENTDTGIIMFGVQAAITRTVVRDTQADMDGEFGAGMEASCDTNMHVCPTLNLTDSLIHGNTGTGVMIASADAVVTSTVVRGTLPQENDDMGGQGIHAQCNADENHCGSLTVTDSLIEQNRNAGILTFGVNLTVISSVMRDTLPRLSDLTGGEGIHAQCDVAVQTCDDLTVTGSILVRNHEAALLTAATNTTVVSTLIRDTLERQTDEKGGAGIEARCDPDLDTCGTVSLDGCVIEANRGVGLFAAGVDASVNSSVVRDTQPQRGDGLYGRGIEAQCNADLGVCGSLAVTDSLVRSNTNVGIAIFGVPATLDGVAVTETVPNAEGPWRGDYAQGVFAMCHPDSGECGTLAMTSCLLASNHTAGLAVQGVSGFVESSVIKLVPPRPLDEAFGYGIQVEGLRDQDPPLFHIRTCRVLDASLSGILFYNALGTVTGSEVAGGAYSVVANIGSAPEIGDHNNLSGASHDGLYWANMDPSPAPPPALPTGTD